MNINAKIEALLGQTGLPVVQDEYEGAADKYIVYIYEDETPAAWGDDRVTADTSYLQVQLITPKDFNYFQLKHEIRNLLEGADFIVASIRSFLGSVYVGTQKIRQTVFSVTYTEQRKMEG